MVKEELGATSILLPTLGFIKGDDPAWYNAELALQYEGKNAAFIHPLGVLVNCYGEPVDGSILPKPFEYNGEYFATREEVDKEHCLDALYEAFLADPGDQTGMQEEETVPSEVLMNWYGEPLDGSILIKPFEYNGEYFLTQEEVDKERCLDATYEAFLADPGDQTGMQEEETVPALITAAPMPTIRDQLMAIHHDIRASQPCLPASRLPWIQLTSKRETTLQT